MEIPFKGTKESPKVNYYTAMDVWMFFCIAKVFLALVAFTFGFGHLWPGRTESVEDCAAA
jgi:hypothetical protein